MPATLPRKALISISSYHGVLYPDGTKTGLFYTEALHPYEVLTQAGFDVDLASETGTYGLDDLSLTDRFLAGDDKAVFDNPDHPFNVKLTTQLKKAADLDGEEYGLFFGSAGHAALYDYPTARGLQVAAENVWQRGGIVAAVCHGPVLLPGVIDSKTGKSIIHGKTVTGFTVEGEVVLEVLDKLTASRSSSTRSPKRRRITAPPCSRSTTTPFPAVDSSPEPIPPAHAAELNEL
jgi:putative intracellular protease/amidase